MSAQKDFVEHPHQVVVPSAGHTLIYENSEVKVFETFLQKGQKLPMHSHLPHVRYLYTAGVNLHTWPNGTTSVLTDTPDSWEVRESLEHAVENIGDAAIHSIIFDFRRPGSIRAGTHPTSLLHHPKLADVAAVLPETKLVAEIPSVFAFEATLPPHFTATKPLLFSPALVFSFTQTVRLSRRVSFSSEVAVDVAAKRAHWFEVDEYYLSNLSDQKARILVCFPTQQTASKL